MVEDAKKTFEKNRPRVVFLGSPEEVVVIFSKLLSLHDLGMVELVGVVTQPSKPTGRGRVSLGTPVFEAALIHREKYGYKIFTPTSAREEAFKKELLETHVDIAITAAYGQILDDQFLSIPKRATINIHPSKLPKLRGATPVQTALLLGVNRTAVTTLFTVRKLDAGPLIDQIDVDIAAGEKSTGLMARLFEIASDRLENVLGKLADVNFCGTPQDEHRVTHCAKIEKIDGRICWESLSAYEIENRFRAFCDWPKIYTFLNGTKIQLTDVVSLESKIEDSALVQPGDFFFDKKFLRLLVLAGGGSLLSVGRCIKEGKSETTAESFWNGLAAQNGPRRFESLPPKSRIVVAVSGSGRTLENLLSSQGEFGFQIVGVISSRSCRGEEIASSHNIPVFRFDANSDALKSWLLESSKPDLIVLAGYLKIFPVFDEFRGRIFNIHPSLLPKFGGKGFFGHNVHEAVLASGESYSGASVHLVDEVYDRGAVVSQSKVKVSPTDTAETLAAKVFAVEKNLLPRTLADIIQGNIRPPYSKVKVYRF